jgi:hypothetical protein
MKSESFAATFGTNFDGLMRGEGSMNFEFSIFPGENFAERKTKVMI